MANPRMPMLEFLLKKGHIQKEQAEEAIKVSQQTKSPIDRVVIQLNFAGEREVMEARAQEAGLGFADLDRMTIESSALNIVPERIVKNHSAIPVRKDGQTLWVAMSNPNNVAAIDDLRVASGCRVVPVLAVKGAIEDAIVKYYGGGQVKKESDAAPAKAAAPAPSAETRAASAER